MDNQDMINVLDLYLVELGTTEITDARKARNQLLDLRLMLMEEMENVPVLN